MSDNNGDSEPFLPNGEDPEPGNGPRTGSVSPGPTNFASSPVTITSESSDTTDCDEEVDNDDDNTPKIVKVVGAPSTSKMSFIKLTRSDSNNTHDHDLRKRVTKRVRDKSPAPKQSGNGNKDKKVNERKRGRVLKPPVHSNDENERKEKFLYPRFIKDSGCKSEQEKVLELYDFDVNKIERSNEYK